MLTRFRVGAKIFLYGELSLGRRRTAMEAIVGFRMSWSTRHAYIKSIHLERHVTVTRWSKSTLKTVYDNKD